MEQLKQMKEMLTSCVQGQMTHLDSVDTKELGEAIDMIKDLAEVIYYCTVTEAMEHKEKEGNGGGQREMMYYPVMYYQEKSGNTDGRDSSRGGREGGGRRNYEDEMYYPERDMDFMKGRMYYSGGSGSGSGGSGGRGSGGGNSSSGGGGGGSSSGGSGSRNYSEREMGSLMRDQREGRSPMSRKNYMESKEMYKDKASQLQELDKYAQELTSDLVEMVEGASAEEKQFLSNKIAALATKIK